MKKLTNYLYIIIVFSIISSSCKQREFDDNFYDPEKSVTATVEGLFTGFLYNNSFENRNTIFPRYWILRTFQIPMPARYAQVIGYSNNTGRYEQSTAYSEERWNYFYSTHLASFRLIEKKMASLSTAEQTEYQPFVEIAKILLYDQAAQMVDMWGDIPFFDAGQLITTSGSLNNAKYDDAKELYTFFLNDLKRISDFLATNNFNQGKKVLFNANDIFFKGDIKKWTIYANSLRLRLAMRVSYTDETFAKSIVQEILTNSTTYPIVTSNEENISVNADGPILRAIIGRHEGGIRGGLLGEIAPGKMINSIMNPTQDPRLAVLFSKNPKGQYVGENEDWNQIRQSDSIAKNYFSRLDSATFGKNDQFPGIIITAAEINLFKAEALERWGIGNGTAKDHYEAGITQSIENYYAINNLNQNSDGTSYVGKVKPAFTEVTTFLNQPIIQYTGSMAEKLEKIGTQQWINYGIIQAYHAWAEVRRTGYPVLYFSEDTSSPNAKKPPLRLLYPSKERELNTKNYSAVADQDRVDIKIFWQR